MIALTETFFANWFNFGEKTSRSVFELTDEQAKANNSEINKDNLIIKKDGINVNDN